MKFTFLLLHYLYAEGRDEKKNVTQIKQKLKLLEKASLSFRHIHERCIVYT